MTDTRAQVERARRAAAAGDWSTARDLLAAARDAGADLDLDDLCLLRDAAWWLGRGAESMAAGEQVYERLEAAGRVEAAARQALELGLQWSTRGDLAVGRAWTGRARRLLAGLDPCPTHGYLRYAEAALELDLYGDPTPARAAADELRTLARDHADPSLGCLARVLEGLAAVRAGEVALGFQELDEAMLDVISGKVEPLWAGDIHCTVIHLSHQLGDWGRMRDWNDSLARWAAPLSRTFLYAGVTRVHTLELVSAEGGWDAVVSELGETSDLLVGSHGWLAAAGYHELGEVLRHRGDRDGAAAAFARARDLLGADPQPGVALLALDRGRPDEALAGLRVALAGQGALERARLLLPTVVVGHAAGDDAIARAAADELAQTAVRYDTPGLRGWAEHAAALVALHDQRFADAVEHAEAALALYRTQRLAHPIAQVHEVLAAARRGLGDTHGAAADAATAAAAYRRLGATVDVERLTGAGRPGGLTAREEEILALVAAGATNRDVARALVISEKTVSRHLANIFTKIGVGSRTAAAAWAHEHGIQRTPHVPA